MALIPAAASLAKTGATNDAMAIAGRRILREFTVRGYNNPNQWEVVINAAATAVDDAGNPVGVFSSTTGPLSTPRRAFCLDPVGYSLWEKENNVTLDANTPEPLYSFPSLPSLDPLATRFLPRLRTRAFQNNSIASNFPADSSNTDESFYFQDDIEFELPQTAAQNPLQTPLRQPGGAATERYSTGEFSWFATLVPEAAALPTSSPSYRLSIAIVRARNSFKSAWLPVSDVSFFDGSGLIELDVSGATSETNEIFAGLRPGQWLMMMNGASGNVRNLLTSVPHQYEWYQVTSNDGNQISVNGPSWASTDQSLGYGTIAVVVPGVESVYSKTIELKD